MSRSKVTDTRPRSSKFRRYGHKQQQAVCDTGNPDADQGTSRRNFRWRIMAVRGLVAGA